MDEYRTFLDAFKASIVAPRPVLRAKRESVVDRLNPFFNRP